MPRRRITPVRIVVAVALLIAALLAYAAFIEPNWLVPERLSVPCSGVLGRPLRIVLFGDVNFPTGEHRRAELERAAHAFAPDLVLVAGDELDSDDLARDPNVIEAAGRSMRDLAGASPILLAPGEEESPRIGPIARAWAPLGIEALANERRTLTLADTTVDLYVADLARDAATWTLRHEGGSTFASQNEASLEGVLLRSGPERIDWRDAEITFAFRLSDDECLFDARLAWNQGPRPWSGNGWKIEYRDDRPAMHLVPVHPGKRVISGLRMSHFVPPAGTWCRARVRVREEDDGTRILARFWPEWAAEPPSWGIDVLDRSAGRKLDGVLGFSGTCGSRSIAEVRASSAGHEVFREDFDDGEAFAANWRQTSALWAWMVTPVPGAARVILVHNPDLVRNMEGLGGSPPCIVLAGHTHGGQVRLPLLGALSTSTHLGTRYDAGLFVRSGIRFYITRGVGMSVLPFRFLTPPEITLITLEPGA